MGQQRKLPVKSFTIGDRVTHVTGTTGVIVDAMVTGTRHPGYLYTVRTEDGRTVYAPTGLLSNTSEQD